MVTFFSLIILIIGMVLITYLDSMIYHVSFLKAWMEIAEFKIRTERKMVFAAVGFSFIYAVIVDYRLKKDKGVE